MRDYRSVAFGSPGSVCLYLEATRRPEIIHTNTTDDVRQQLQRVGLKEEAEY